MKKPISIVLAAVCLFVALSVAPAHAYSTSVKMKAHIPFEFTVAGKTFPAGEYTFEPFATRVLLIRSTDRRYATTVTTSPVQPESETKAEVRFIRYGDQYYLFQVLIGGGTRVGFETPRTATEKEVAKNLPVPEKVMVKGKK